MAASLNLPRRVEQVEANYRGKASVPSPADARAAARRAGHLSWFIRLSLDEPEAMRHMQGLAGELRNNRKLDALLPQILDGALALTGADFGSVQLLDPASGALVIVTQSGFGSEFTDHFANVGDEHSASGRAARDFAQTVIADVATDPASRRIALLPPPRRGSARSSQLRWPIPAGAGSCSPGTRCPRSGDTGWATRGDQPGSRRP